MASRAKSWNSELSPAQREELMQRIEDLARPALFHNNEWTVDYRRLRMIAVKQ